MKYQLLQGIMTLAGNGDHNLVRESDDLESLKEDFNRIKNDYIGWSTSNQNDLIETVITEVNAPEKVIEFNSISIKDAKNLDD